MYNPYDPFLAANSLAQVQQSLAASPQPGQQQGLAAAGLPHSLIQAAAQQAQSMAANQAAGRQHQQHPGAAAAGFHAAGLGLPAGLSLQIANHAAAAYAQGGLPAA